MNAAPLRRAIAVIGLLVLLPTAFLLATGQLSPLDAGMRAFVTAAGVALLQRAGRWGVRRAALARAQARADGQVGQAGTA